jgi:hypothetical protein
MSNHTPHDQKQAQRQAKIEKHDHISDHIFRRVLHYVERAVATITMVVLIFSVAYQVYMLVTDMNYLFDINDFLHNILTIVVGFEFVRMMIDTTPANILEVLTVAITRHVILSHDDYWSNLVCIACIAGLFAIRRYLIRRSELKEEMVEIE